MTITFLNFFLFASAVWRLASLFANEDGPFCIFKYLREYAKRLTEHTWLFAKFHLHDGLCCEWCNSIWFGTALGFAWWYFGDVFLIVLIPLCASTWAIMFKYVLQAVQKQGQ